MYREKNSVASKGKNIIRLIHRMLKAGIMKGYSYEIEKSGSGQGSTGKSDSDYSLDPTRILSYDTYKELTHELLSYEHIL